MWMEKLKNGKVRYLERYTDPLTGREKRTSIVIKPTGRKSDRKVAENALRAKIARLTEAIAPDRDITLQDLVDKRIEWEQAHLKEQTAASCDYHLRRVVELIGPDALIRRLSAPIVADRLSSSGPITYNERLKHFKSLMRWAYRYDYIDSVEWLDKLQREKEPTAKEKDQYKYMEKREMQVLLQSMTVEKWKLLTEFLILSGLRIGEAIALTAQDVRMQDREITVNKTYSLTIHKISTTKTETSDRIVYMQDELLSVCARIRRFIAAEKLKYAYRTDIFIPDEDGGYINYASYCKYLRENTEAVLGRRLTPHALRHTHVAMLAEAGIPLETISRRLGHADSRITRDVYYHVTEKMKERERERLNNIRIIM